EEKAGKSVLHAAGLYYVQEPSAMSAAPLLQVKRGERVLDMCSAPGGKGTQLAQNMCGEGVIVLNEVNFSRAKILSQNVERLGITNAAVISESPERLAEHFEGYFDKVLVDAPCSGEGMFLKEESAVREWSEENVKACARRQSLILDCAQKVLKAGGYLVYSTCTFAPEEDEEQIESFLKKYENFRLISDEKLMPHCCAGEGHFVALLQKTDGESREVKPFQIKSPDKKTLELYRDFEKRTLKRTPFKNLHIAGELIYSVPEDFPSLPFKTLRAGVRLAELLSGRVEPCHSLAMSLNCDEAVTVEVEEPTAISYLSGNTFQCNEALNGWALVTHLGYPLGWCKAVNGTAKNHLPKGLRI
ncbi:MAG: RsmB/NOP family class I SAM-dependent RNA methyltransferase, partial [Clostridia bacterium]|nr:RsmB/NOP family class I SAM-dependent RNA methyltransferase [Clostridia bacterium]